MFPDLPADRPAATAGSRPSCTVSYSGRLWQFLMSIGHDNASSSIFALTGAQPLSLVKHIPKLVEVSAVFNMLTTVANPKHSASLELRLPFTNRTRFQ